MIIEFAEIDLFNNKLQKGAVELDECYKHSNFKCSNFAPNYVS